MECTNGCLTVNSFLVKEQSDFVCTNLDNFWSLVGYLVNEKQSLHPYCILNLTSV